MTTKSIFEEKKEWPREELKRKLLEASPYIPDTGGEMYSYEERKKMIDTLFPYERFQSYISENEFIQRLRELRKEELEAHSAKQMQLRRLRRYLERITGLEGKY